MPPRIRGEHSPVLLRAALCMGMACSHGACSAVAQLRSCAVAQLRSCAVAHAHSTASAVGIARGASRLFYNCLMQQLVSLARYKADTRINVTLM
jgi:hypothetical protein